MIRIMCLISILVVKIAKSELGFFIYFIFDLFSSFLFLELWG